MLIQCPECDNKISDKAITCIFCGYPLQASLTAAPAAKPKVSDSPKSRKRMKLPNGTGSIQKLSGKRRKPYAAYPPVCKADFDDNGKCKKPKALGYFRTYYDAYDYLSEWRKTHDLSIVRSASTVPTFAELYAQWFDYETTHGKKKSESWVYGKRSGFSYLKPLHDRTIDTIFTNDMQDCIDACDKKYSTRSNIKDVCSGIFKYCIKNGLCSVNYAKFLYIGENDNEKGVPFTMDEICRLWDNSSDPDVQLCLIYIYTGYRATELNVIDVDYKNNIMLGGKKTIQGRKRIVPIHPAIKDFIRSADFKGYDYDDWRDNNFKPLMQKLGMSHAASGELHTIHDFRHTFSWLCDYYKMDDVSKHLIMGHSVGSDVERKVYAHRTNEELYAEILKIEVPKKFVVNVS